MNSIPYFTEVARELVKVSQMAEGNAVKLAHSQYGEFFQENRDVVVGGYAVLALALVLSSDYRKRMREGGFLVPVVVLLVLAACVVGGCWLMVALVDVNNIYARNRVTYPLPGSFSSELIYMLSGLSAALITIALGITIRIAPFLYVLFLLFFVPGIVYAIAYYSVRFPVLAWHYLHYLFVPHPAEKVFLKHQKMKMKRGVKVDRAALGEELAGVMYKEREGVPAWWKSENWLRRLEALKRRMKAEKDIVGDEEKDARERNRRQKQQREEAL